MKNNIIIHTRFLGFLILPCHWPGPERSASWYRQRRATWWGSMHKRYISIWRKQIFYHYALLFLPCLNLRTYFMLILFDLDTFTYGCPVRMATSWVDAAEAGQLNEEHGTNLVCRYLSFLDNSVVNPGNLEYIFFFLFIFGNFNFIIFLHLNLMI